MTQEQMFNADIGNRLKAERMKKRVSREKLGERIKAHRNSILRWERGETPISLWEFVSICRVLGLKHAEIVKE